MSRWMSRSVAPVVAVVAIAAAGCGSSSSSSNSPTPAGTPSAPTSTGGPVGSLSTPVTSPVFKASLERNLRSSGASASKAPAIVKCIVPALQAKGINTAGDFVKQPGPAQTIVKSCLQQVGLK